MRYRPIFLLVFAVSPALLCGCAQVGAVTYKVFGEPPVPAQYVPAKTKPMLVLVENYRNPSAAGLDGHRLTRHLVDELRKHKVAPVVDTEQLEAVRTRVEFRTMKIEEVGRAAGAGQVLYVHQLQVRMSDTVGGEVMKCRADMRVRVVDVESGQTLWPRPLPEGYAVSSETPWVRSAAAGREATAEPALRDQVALDAAKQIVKLFRSWKRDEDGAELEETVR